MDMWLVIYMSVILTAVVISIHMSNSYRLKKDKLNALELNRQQVELLERLDTRLSGIEDRMANIETLVVEKERNEKFDVLQDA